MASVFGSDTSPEYVYFAQDNECVPEYCTWPDPLTWDCEG